MFEKVNPSHPDKLADRIAGACVDFAYSKEENPKVAVEVLLGHGECTVIIESSVKFRHKDVLPIVKRITGINKLNLVYVPQDKHLADNQKGKIRCGDNGIFKGMPITKEQILLNIFIGEAYERVPFDGKAIINDEKVVACISNDGSVGVDKRLSKVYGRTFIYNPLGPWTGGPDVDSGATNRKLGSDMGDAVTGGGLHGKDLSKADVSLNIYAHILAQALQKPVELTCGIGDETVNGVSYESIVEIARDYIKHLGGFEKFAEWGLIRP